MLLQQSISSAKQVAKRRVVNNKTHLQRLTAIMYFYEYSSSNEGQCWLLVSKTPNAGLGADMTTRRHVFGVKKKLVESSAYVLLVMEKTFPI